MSAALAVWSVRIEPGKKTNLIAQSDIRISNAALDAELADKSGRSSVKLTYTTPQAIDEDDKEESLPPTTSTVLCSLTPGKVEHASLDLIINEDDEIDFEVIGKNAVYLSGNYITQPNDFPVDDSELESDEEDYDLRYVSSDAELDPSELDPAEVDSEQDDSHRFEEIKSDDEKVKKEIKSSPPPSKKRPRESDAAESGADQKLSKKQKKKLNKKLKTEDGEAVANGNAKQEVKKEVKEEKIDTTGRRDEKKKGEVGALKKQGELKELPSGLKVKDVKTGSGKAAKKGDLVYIRYIGKFTNDKIFDKNTKGKPFSFRLGLGEVIKGWDEGIAGMQAGGERLLIVPPHLGYGSRRIADIPSNSTLKFECRLLEIKS